MCLQAPPQGGLSLAITKGHNNIIERYEEEGGDEEERPKFEGEVRKASTMSNFVWGMTYKGINALATILSFGQL